MKRTDTQRETVATVEVDANKAIGVLGVEGGEGRLYAILKDHGVYVVSGEVTTRF